jgi:hypothetical protein
VGGEASVFVDLAADLADAGRVDAAEVGEGIDGGPGDDADLAAEVGGEDLVAKRDDGGLRHGIELGDEGVELLQRLHDDVDVADHEGADCWTVRISPTEPPCLAMTESTAARTPIWLTFFTRSVRKNWGTWDRAARRPLLVAAGMDEEAGSSERRMTALATLPMTMRPMPERPWVPMAMRSAPVSLAARRMPSTARSMLTATVVCTPRAAMSRAALERSSLACCCISWRTWPSICGLTVSKPG